MELQQSGKKAPHLSEAISLEIDNEQKEIDAELLEFYNENLDVCKSIPFSNVPHSIIKEISKSIHCKLLLKADWKDILAELGLEDRGTLQEIEVVSSYKQELPFSIAADKFNLGNFSTIINLLIEKKLFNVLQKIKISVNEFLNEYRNAQGRKVNYEPYFESVSSTFDSSKFPPVYNEGQVLESVLNSSNNGKEIDHNQEYDYDFEINAFLKQSINKTQLWKELETLQCSTYFTECFKRDNIHQSVPLNPLKVSHLNEENISLFITHSDKDTTGAVKLASAFRQQYGFIVLLQSEVNYLLPIRGSEFLYSLLQKVDYIVPYVSHTYLREIEPLQDENLHSANSLNVRYIFKLLYNEYINDSCLNFRTRPARLNELQFSAVKKNPLLKEAFPLWTNFTALAETLIKTKQLFKSYKSIYTHQHSHE